ncbi:hypothetical protein OSB04_004140 [Centaurea solstitialis]|uniref:beta-aspartyl-peptidase n=1 Tax=Centaurea solstitialis TaxID=347529 RepID=A0AA38WVH7_9ASTR|nr:hypothetical protein OSB04_004140 [Centaurea solstitialis]
MAKRAEAGPMEAGSMVVVTTRVTIGLLKMRLWSAISLPVKKKQVKTLRVLEVVLLLLGVFLKCFGSRFAILKSFYQIVYDEQRVLNSEIKLVSYRYHIDLGPIMYFGFLGNLWELESNSQIPTFGSSYSRELECAGGNIMELDSNSITCEPNKIWNWIPIPSGFQFLQDSNSFKNIPANQTPPNNMLRSVGVFSFELLEVVIESESMGWAIALHGGAGAIPADLPPERRQPEKLLSTIGIKALNAKSSPLDVVELVLKTKKNETNGIQTRVYGGKKVLQTSHRATTIPPGPSLIRAMVCELENCPYFNAGKGSVLTDNGTVEMEACIMDGNSKSCGAVSGVSTVVNPISLARRIMEKTPHIYLAFDGAEAFAREQASQNILGLETTDKSHFITTENIERLKQAKEANRVQQDYTIPIKPEDEKETGVPDGDSKLGTVGCVAVDSLGNLAAATSTGGLVNKMVGRIGDTPIIGAGTYANKFCAVSATGRGEAIIRETVARDVAAVMEYKGLGLKEAADYIVHQVSPKGTTGLVAVSPTGEVAMPFNTIGMFRACATEDGFTEVAIWPSET